MLLVLTIGEVQRMLQKRPKKLENILSTPVAESLM